MLHDVPNPALPIAGIIMQGTNMKKLIVALALAATMGSNGSAPAQVYPSRPVTMVVGAPAGGPTDTIARVVAEHMRSSLGQSILIENNSAAASSVAAGRVARAAPDGYTISVGHWGSHVVNGVIYALPYDVLNDFEPIALIASTPQLIVSRNAVPANDLKSLVGWLKANPDKASQGTGGVGSAAHVGGVFFQASTATRFLFVPYRGAAPAMQDLLAGQIDLMFDQATNSLPQIRAGKIRAYAVAAKNRLSAAPEIPTVDEAGLPGFYVAVWHGLWAPKSTPKDVIAKLNGAVVDALADSAVSSRLADLGQDIFPREQQTPEALAAYQKAEIEKWWPIIKAANIKVE